MASSFRLPALAVVLLVLSVNFSILSPSALCELGADGAPTIDAPSVQEGTQGPSPTTPWPVPATTNGGPLSQAAPSDGTSRPVFGSSGSESVLPQDSAVATCQSVSLSYPEPDTRYPVPIRSGPDVTPVLIEYIGPNPAIGKFGAAAVGKPTQFNITVTNYGTVDAAPVALRVTVTDYFRNIVGDYPTSIPTIAAGASVTAYWKYWTPLFSTVFSVNATVNTAGDANTTNNTLIITGLMSNRWLDTGDSSLGWSGDIGPGVWGITTTDPFPGGHSGPATWHCGQNGYYLNDTDASLITPPLDLTMMNPNYYILFNFNYHGYSVPGDAVNTYATDDDGITWYPLFAELTGSGASAGWSSRISHWQDNDGDNTVDQNEPHEDGLDISKFCGRVIKIKFRFTSDGSYNEKGFFLDDFVLRGWENLNGVALLRVGAENVDRLGVEQTFVTAVQNIGQSAQNPFSAHLNISDGTSLSKTVTALQPGELRNISWSWTPALPGNFTVQCTIVPQSDDVSEDNSLWRPVHVAAGNASTLLVDDDSGPGNNGALRGTAGADVEWGVKEALTMAEYDIYLVGDGSGPPIGIMQDYGLVIWVTGYDDTASSRAGTLTAADRLALGEYMDGGGRLWLISFETLWDSWTVWGDQSFIRNHLHVMSFGDGYDDQGMPTAVDGLQDDPITDGMHFDTTGPPPGLWDKSDKLANASDAPGIFYQYDFVKDRLTGPFNALRHSGKTKFVFMGFELTFIRMPADRALLTARAMDWLWGGASIQPGKGGVQGYVVPGGKAVYNITLASSEQRNWKVESIGPGTVPPGWEAKSSLSVVNGSPSQVLSPMGSLPFQLELSAPPDAPAGLVVNVSVVVRMAGSPGTISIATRTTVLPVAGVKLSSAEPVRTAEAGGEAIFMVSVTNEGNYDNQVNLSLRGEAAPWCQLSRSSLFISGGRNVFVQVAADLPTDVLAGAHNLTVKAETQNGTDTLQAQLGLTISVNTTRNLKIEGSPAGQVVNIAETLQTTISVDISNYGNHEETAIVAICATFGGWQQWSFTSQSRQMQPFEKARTVKLEVGIPASATAGYYNLTVRLGYQSGDQADKRNTVVELRVPDLSIFASDVRISPSKPSPRDNLEISVVVRNNGTAEARNIAVAFTLNDKQAGVARVNDAVQPGLTVTASVFCRGIRYGENLLRVSVDPDGAIPELTDENNQAELAIFGHQPDISIGAVSFQAVGRAQPRDNSTVTEGMVEVSAVIVNSGSYCIDVDNVDVNFSVDGVVFETRVVSVRAGSETVATALWFSKKGSHRIQVTVDPGRRIEESSEANNEAALPVNVLGAAKADVDIGQWIPLLVGIVAVVIVVGVLAYHTLRSKKSPSAPPELDRLRSFRAKQGSKHSCFKCGKPILGGSAYLKCDGCEARYHPDCASSGLCERCAEEEAKHEEE